ncbi:MAG: nitroreductase family protein [Nitrososphaerota archaeon]
MDVLDAIRKRVAVRYFEEKPVPEDVLKTLAWAAHKAPTGGNTPYRRVMVVNDEEIVEMVKKVSPGFLSNAKALILIYTDLDIAYKGLGRLGRDICSMIDAGAAAENVALAALKYGLGTCFTKSYSEAGVKEVLEIPENYRTEVMVQIGYPKKDMPPPLKAKPNARITYLNRHGNLWT